MLFLIICKPPRVIYMRLAYEKKEREGGGRKEEQRIHK